MKTNRLSIDIGASVEKVFRFCLDSTNTPKWIPTVLEERASDPVVKVGTVYYQRVLDKRSVLTQSAIVVTGLVEYKQLDFHSVNGAYACYYRFESIPSGTRLTYIEEAGLEEELDSLPESCLQTLKRLIEGEQE